MAAKERAMASKTNWTITGRELVNCNCDYGCPCQFNALPTNGSCHAVVGVIIDSGLHGAVRLDGLSAVALYQWPGPIHKGNGTAQFIVDEKADASQRVSIERILKGEDTDDMATMWWVFSKMSPAHRPTLFTPIEFEVDVDKRTGRIRVPGLVDTQAEPIRNPVTGAEHRARIDMPHGFEYRLAEVASGTSKVSGDLAMQ
ncbi:MAG: DUF1326 domain-containing protein, partial [Verrucomicrobiales bacterium]